MRSVFANSASLLLAAALGLGAAPAFADDQAAPATPAAPAAAPAAPKPPPSWWDNFKVSGYVEFGITGNPDESAGNLNVGHLFTDKANEFMFNQGSLIVERDPDTSGGFDWGFRFQGMVGSDARYTHFLGEGDYGSSDIIQFDVLEASWDAHLPFFTAGGEDLKVGQFATLLGAETIDPRSNTFYSHSYIFNFGLPLKDTGVQLIAHVSPLVDLYASVITGENTSIGPGGDNNGALAFEGGVGFNISDKLTIVAYTNVGPENACVTYAVLYSCNSSERYFGDLVATYKITDALTSTTELNFVHDQGPFLSGGGKTYSPSAGGVAQYFTYTINDMISAGVRGEVFRDANGFFVTAFPGSNNDFVNCEWGLLSCKTIGTFAPTTYGEITLGLNIKPPNLPSIIKGFVIRPEIRFDDALSGPAPFDPKVNAAGFTVGTKGSQVTLAVDATLSF
jgi:hypothetical protein